MQRNMIMLLSCILSLLCSLIMVGCGKDNVCCEMYGYGAYQKKGASTFKIVPRDQCSDEDLDGGGRDIVDMSRCGR